MKSDDLRERLEPLMIALTDGTLTDEQSAALADSLRNNPAAQRYYAHYMFIHASLAWHESEPVAAPSSVDSPKPAASRSRSLLQRASRHPRGPAIAIAIAVMLMIVGAMAVTPVSKWLAGGEEPVENDTKPGEKTEHVAILSNWRGANWLENTRPPLNNPRLLVGKRLVIESGLIEVTYFTGARVVIEGPAEFVIGRMKDEGATEPAERLARREGEGGSLDATNAGFLRHGSLVARVEGEDAQGFTIDTPFARVEDLGTEFGVEVARSGRAEVVVLSGEVDVVRESGDGPAQRVRLVQDQAASVTPKSPAITLRRTVDPRFVAAMRSRLDAMRDLPTATSTVVSIDFDSDNHVQSGEPTHAAGPTLRGQVGDWYKLSVGSSGSSPSIETPRGTFTFNTTGAAYRSHKTGSNALREDFFWLTDGHGPISWTLTGLTPNGTYNIILYSRYETSFGGYRGADFSIVGYNDGKPVAQEKDASPEGDVNFASVRADEAGKIEGVFARNQSIHAEWGAIQFEEIQPAVGSNDNQPATESNATEKDKEE